MAGPSLPVLLQDDAPRTIDDDNKVWSKPLPIRDASCCGHPLTGDPYVCGLDHSQETTYNDRDNLLRLCDDKKLQFNTMRCGKYSTMMVLNYIAVQLHTLWRTTPTAAVS